MFDRHYVYQACLLAASEGVDVGGFGNACDRTNRGEYRSAFYQGIAAKYGEAAKALGPDACFKRYMDWLYRETV